MRNDGMVMAKVDLLEQVFDANPDGAINIVEVYVGYLRRKLGAVNHRHGAQRVSHGWSVNPRCAELAARTAGAGRDRPAAVGTAWLRIGSWWSQRTIRTRLVALTIVPLVVALCIGTVAVALLFSAGRIRSVDRQTRTEATTLAALAQSGQLPSPLPVPAGSALLAQVIDAERDRAGGDRRRPASSCRWSPIRR